MSYIPELGDEKKRGIAMPEGKKRSEPSAREIIDASAKLLAKQMIADMRQEAEHLHSWALRMEEDLAGGFRPQGAFTYTSNAQNLACLWGKVQAAYDALRTVSNVEVLK